MGFNDFSLSFGLKGKLRLNRTWNQNFVMGCILFCLTGMYLAVSGLGAGGSSAQQQHVISTASAITFGVYALSGWLGGTILNFVKPKLMIMLAAIGYPLYVGSLWYLNKTGNPWFTYLAGTILGIAAGMLWTAAGFISFAYASEDEKASFISIQWAIVSVGGSIGSLVAFGINYHAEESKASNTIYAVFISIMCIAILLALLFIVDPKHVTRSDGTHIAVFRQAKFSTELKRLAALFADWRVWILLPGMFVAEMNLTTMGVINAWYFNLRTRSLNNVCIQLISIPVPLLLAALMDSSYIKSRKTRGYIGVAVMGVVTLGTCAASIAWIYKNDIKREVLLVDWTDDRFAAAFVVYLFNGIVYGTYQICIQWVLAALTNDPEMCSRYAGLFKGTVGLGLCVSFVLDARYVSFLNQEILLFCFLASGIVALFVVIKIQVRETNYFLEDNVITPLKFEEKLQITTEQKEKERYKEELAIQIDNKATIIPSVAEVKGEV